MPDGAGDVKEAALGVDACRGRNASDAALSRRFVVPRAFVEPERAEQTMASLWSSRKLLEPQFSQYVRSAAGFYVRHNLAGDLLRELADTGTAILLYNPFSRWVD